ncbi:MAG: PTS sugar transporter subunit IIA [bacterium]|nr:PTS sugar transporter subunit IIA [bacterium]
MSDLVQRYLRADRILLDMKATKKADAIREVAFLLEVSEEVPDFRRFLSMLFQKESRYGSGVGDGVAIPHYRDDRVQEPVICLGVSREGLEWGKTGWGEKEQVQILVLIGWPYRNDDAYLNTVAEMARLLRLKAVRDKILDATTPEEVLKALTVNGHAREKVSC